ncbi:MAG: hypothetical protein ACOY3E_12235 [Pseudomonadota bacterium]
MNARRGGGAFRDRTFSGVLAAELIVSGVRRLQFSRQPKPASNTDAPVLREGFCLPSR